MCKKFIPYAHGQNIFDVDITFFVSHNIKTLLVDLDNTLDSYRATEPSKRVLELKSALDKAGIELIVISNNKEKRVSHYAQQLGVRFLFSTHKPFTRRLKKFIKDNNIDISSTMLVGDQLITDVLMANNAKLRVLLTEKLVKEDQWTTHINRIFDRPIRRHLAKKGKLVDWRDKLWHLKKR